MMEESAILKKLLGEFWDKLDRIKDFTVRDAEFSDVSGKIKVAMGMRRSGKTYFVYQHIFKLIREGIPKSSILYINFEDDRLLPTDQKKMALLIDAFFSLYPENYDRRCYLFLDEIQNVDHWPLVVRRLQDSKDVEIYLTGSSAKLLSKEIATSLRGRALATEIWPYSFQEYLRAKKICLNHELYDKKTEDKLTHLFLDYLTSGGFPEIVAIDNPDFKQKILQEYIDIAIYRDIIERHGIKTTGIIKEMILSMLHNVGRPFSINKFYNDLKSRGYSVTKDVLYDYADHIEDAYLAFLVPLYDLSIRKVQTNPKKNYSIDSGIARAVTLDYENDRDRLFENIVYLELRRLECKVSYYLTEERYEIDFIVQSTRGQKKFFQVVWNADDHATMEREQRALHAGMKEQKIEGKIITLNSYLEHGLKI
ncbi:MAG: ATP-binding protein [Verrucomicrobiota bacterium]|nr:ATP-binding protein [Verrucomicrobiota bacterium]